MRWGPENKRKGVQEHYGGENEAPRAITVVTRPRERGWGLGEGEKSMPVYFEESSERPILKSKVNVEQALPRKGGEETWGRGSVLTQERHEKGRGVD